MNAKTKKIINFLVVLLIGIVLGYSAGAYCKWGKCFRGYSKEGGKEAFLLRMYTDKLDLNTEQQTKVEVILLNQGEKMQALREEIGPRFREIREETNTEVEALLSKEQLPKFEELKKRMEEYRKRKWGKKKS